jgi:hypothetical protein
VTVRPDEPGPAQLWSFLAFALPCVATLAIVATPIAKLESRRRQESEATRTLRTLATSVSIMRSGDKDDDGVLDYELLDSPALGE